MERPEYISEEIYHALPSLVEAANENMFTLIPRLIQLFPNLSAYQAQQVLLYWKHSQPDYSF